MATINKRTKIVRALVELFKNITGDSPYSIDLFENVKDKLIFWDEVNQYPLVCVNAGPETREYQPSDFKWGYLTINIRIYVKGDDAKDQLEKLFSDIEYVLDANNNLVFDQETNETCVDIRILNISDDEGLLAPLGVGEIVLQVQYAINN